jgi:hypothetical protein
LARLPARCGAVKESVGNATKQTSEANLLERV